MGVPLEPKEVRDAPRPVKVGRRIPAPKPA